MLNPDQLWYDTVYRFSKQSKCRSRQVGCVIVYENNQIGQGWNGAPDGSTTEQCPRPKCQGDCSKGTASDLDLAICTHSEANAVGYCARHGVSTKGATIYCTTFPCSYCAGFLVAAGIVEVVYDKDYPHMDFSKRIFQNKGIKIRRFFDTALT